MTGEPGTPRGTPRGLSRDAAKPRRGAVPGSDAGTADTGDSPRSRPSAGPGDSPRLTPAQDRAVALSGRDVCVVAGAGSGKTTVLTERFAHVVLSAGSPRDRRRAVDRLLTLTFTEKAATEMRERVARRFAASGDADLRRTVETAWISTFHSFCARLLKENAVEAGVDPRFQVLSEGDAALLLEEAREETVARWAADRPEAFAPLALVAAPSVEDLAASLLAAGPAPAESFADLLAAAANPPSPAGEMEAIRAALRDLAADLDRYEGAAATAAAAAVAAGRSLDGLESVQAIRSFRMPGSDRKGAVPAKPRLLALREACDAAAGVLLAAEAAPAARALAALLGDMEAAYRARKEARGVLDFADLESRALALLEGDPGVREEARARFDAVLVDEYQDTSPVQERLLAALAGAGRTVTVGDPKPAIYGFRGADVAGFGRAREAAGEQGTVVLAENFRSRPEILRFSNAVLAPAFAAGGAEQVPFERLLPGAAHGPKERPSVEIHLVAGEEGGGAGRGDLRPREADLLAARIRALVEGGEARITRSDTPPRALGWGDAAILLRATTDIQVYERALADAGIPYQVVKGRGFFEAREVVDVANLLEALEDPARDLALAATLRSPFAGLDDRTLLALVGSLPRDGEERAPLSTALEPGARPPAGISTAMRARLARFRGTWAGLHALRRRGRLHEVLDAALRRTGYADSVLLRGGGRQRAANLRKVLGRARSFEDAGLGGAAEFVRLVRRLRLREERETEAPLAAEDAVSLMTVHQAKGLEWPLVVLPDLGRRPVSPSGAVLAHGGRAGLRIRRGGEKTPLWLRIQGEIEAASDAEAVRLFHVALTRAKEHLVLSSGVKGEPERRVTGLSILAPHLPEEGPEGGEGIVVVGRGTPDEVEVLLSRSAGPPAAAGAQRVSLALERRKRLLGGRGPGVRLAKGGRRAVEEEVDGVLALVPPAADGTPFLATVSAVLDWGSCALRYRLGHEIGVPDRSPPPAEGREHDEDPSLASTAGHGVPRWISGVAAHAVLGTMDLLRDGDAEIRATAAARLREDLDGEPPAEALEEVVGWVAGFLASPLGLEVRAAAGREGHLLREVPFLCREEGVLLRGQIDLVVRGADGAWTLADYKASRPPKAAEKRGRYERQLRIYARALAGVPLFEGAPPARGALVYLDPRVEIVPVPLGPADLAPARDLLARFREGTRGAERRPDRRHCPACPFGPGGTGSCAASRAPG